ncbi:RHS repeat-associated core domain-containing protein [Actinophytocola sp. NPDC049390]|uniref:RHS repeat-associated core domain-containing protein n=1 Tax=Actinophytocola sp. NPDC049390 TaxID=3363894 RepID=UPI00378AC176
MSSSPLFRRPFSRAVRALSLAAVVALVAGLVGDVAQDPVPRGAAGVPYQDAPDQRWGSAAGQPHIERGRVNRVPPRSYRSRYPANAAPAEPRNRASVEVGPVHRTGFDRRTSRERPERRDAHRRTYANTDGTETTEFSATPIHYRDARGDWQPIDTALTAGADGWVNDTNAASLAFAGRGDDAELAVMRFGDHRVAYGLDAARPVRGTAEGATVTYPGIRPGVDLELTARPGGVKETIVLRDSSAPREFRFPLHTGLRPTLRDGRLLLTDRGGATRAVIPPGDMVDAAAALSTAVTYRLDGTTLVVTLDDGWLADPARRYPVRVDPTVSLPVSDGAADTSMYVRGGTSTNGGSELQVGNVEGAATASYLKFTGLTDSLRFHTIYGAQLQLVNYYAQTCAARPVTVHPVTGAWTSTGSYSYPGPSVGSALASRSFSHGYFAQGQSQSACPTAAELFDLGDGGTRLVQGWVNGTTANNGLSLRGNVADASSGKRFVGTAASANRPTLWVTHSPYNAEYAIPNPVPDPPVLQNQDGRVKVTVTNRGAEAWAPGSYYLAYRAYNARTGAAVGQFRAADLTATLARGARTTLTATVKALPPGRYFLDFTMVRTGGIVFTDHQVAPARIVLEITDLPPVVQELYPPNGYQAPTLNPLLWGRAIDVDAPPGSSLTYKFEVCDRDGDGNPVGCTTSAYQAGQAWAPPNGRMVWGKGYLWRVFVKDATTEVASPYSTVFAEVPQPEITARIAGAAQAAQEREYDPQTGNLSTVAVDATVATVGPELNLLRTYNSLDPRRDGAFGAGWTTRYDMRLEPDDDGSGNVVVSYPDGQAVRFGRNADGTYATPSTRTAALTSANGLWTLADRAGVVYTFDSGGRLTRITDAARRAVVLTYGTGARLAKAQVSNGQSNTAGRALRFTWTGDHVTKVTTDLGTSWTYTYDGDVLTKVCAPDTTCTTYTYADGSHYRSAVLDAKPESYWRLGEAEGTGAGSEITVNLGEDAATYSSVTLGTAGALAGGGTAATFNGTSSRVDLPNGVVKKTRDGAVELWFKANTTGTGGPLLGYQDRAFGTTPTRGVPVLYVGMDGRLRGQFGTTTVAPMTSPLAVNDGTWHHVVLSSLGTTQTLYLDGVRIGQTTATLDHALLTFNQLGAATATNPSAWPQWGSAATRFWSGAIDEVAVYSRPLGAAAVAAHHSYGATAADQLAEVTLPSGAVAMRASYDVRQDRVASYTDRDGGTWKIGAPVVSGGADQLLRTVQVNDPSNRPNLYEYDAITGQLLRSGLPLGLELREEDRPGYPEPAPPQEVEECTAPDPGDPKFCTIIPGGSGGPVFVEHPLEGMAIRTYSYDDAGLLATVTNENGDAVRLTYDARGNITSRTTCRTAGSCQTSYTTYPATVTNPFDPRNELPVETRDARSASATDTTYRTSYTYTATGDLATQTEPDGAVVRHTYSTGGEPAVGGGVIPPGLLLTTTDARGKVTRRQYHPNGDLARTTEPGGLVTTFTYDVLGRQVSETEISDSFPNGVTTTTAYDALSRPTVVTDPATTDAVTGVRHQQETVTTYDVDGNPVKVEERDKLGGDATRTTTTEYDAAGRPVRLVDAEGNETTSTYDRFGNLVSTVDAEGNRYDYAYTARQALAEVRLRAYRGDDQGGLVEDYLVVESYSYDYAGRRASTTDAMGRRIEYQYYGDDRVWKMVLKNFRNVDGSTRDFVLEENTYDAAGNPVKKVTGNGTKTLVQTFDRGGDLVTTVEDPAGLARTTSYTYDQGGNVLRVSSSGKASNVPWPLPTTPQVVNYVYDDAGNAVRETVSTSTESLVTTSTYDQRGLQLSTTDPRGNVAGADPAAYTTTFAYDETGQLIRDVGAPVSAEAGGSAETVRPTATYGYNTFGEQTSVRDEVGNVRGWTYDRLGRPVTEVEPAYRAPGATEPVTPTTHTRYDGLGNVVEVTDPRGNSLRYGYDQLGRLVTLDEPATTNDTRAVTRYTYTRTGLPLSTTDPLGARTETTYDDLDRPVTTTEVERLPLPNNFTTTVVYDDAGNVVRGDTPSGAITRSTYDTLGQLTRVTDPNGVSVQYGYDQAGRVVRQADHVGRTTQTVYDGAGRAVTTNELAPDGAVKQTRRAAYDPDGNLVSATDGLGVTTTYSYDADDQLVSQTEPVTATSSITTSFGYDAAGRRTRLTNGLGNSFLYSYNTLGLPETMTEPATAAHPDLADRTWTVAYDVGGNPVSYRAPGGVTRTATFDAAGRLTTETGAGAEAATGSRTLGYDLVDQVVSVNAPGGTNTYTYDDRGNLLTARGPGGSADYSYDADGNTLSREDVAGTAAFTYTNGRLATVTDGLTGSVQRYGYDGAGLLSTVDYGGGRVRTFTYDELGRTTSDVVRNGAGATVMSVAYRYNANNQVTGKTTTGTAGAGEHAYGYDLAGRLTSWTGPKGTVEYGWDAAGNRTRTGDKTATFDARNRLLSDGDYTYTYTARGTRASRTSSGLDERFTFDAFDRMVGALGQTYVYDGLNRLVSKGGSPFTYAGLSDEVVADGTERFARGPEDNLLAVADAAGPTLTLDDEHGDVVGGFAPGDTALTRLSDSTAYDPFGQVTDRAGDTGNIGYQGDWTDEDTGQVNMGARWYDPSSGSFTSRDTVDHPGGDAVLANRYTYGNADPVNVTDPTGNWGVFDKVKKAVSSVVSTVSSAVSSVSSYVSSGISWFARTAWSGLTWTASKIASGAKWVAKKAKSAAKWVGRKVKSAAKWVGRKVYKGLKSVGRSLRKGAKWLAKGGKKAYSYSKKKVRQTVNWTARKAEQARKAAIAKAKQVTRAAQKAAAFAARHSPVKVLLAATRPVLSASKKLVSSAAHLPAKVVAATRDVVADTVKSATAVYQKAVDTAGAVVENVSKAVDTVADLAQAASPYLKAALKVAADMSGVTDLVACVTKGDLEACAWTAATIGGYLLGGAGGGAVRAARVASLAARHTDDAADVVRTGRRLTDKADDVSSCAADLVGSANSFAGDTRVRMADGTTKRIDEVRVGDVVLATDPTTGRGGPRVVTAVVEGTGVKDLVEVRVGGSEIVATQGHPVWLGRWVDAGDLATGDRVTAGTVTATREWTERRTVYNLTVDGLHTYHVVAGDADLLVHNADFTDLCGKHDMGWNWAKCQNKPTCGKKSPGAREERDPKEVEGTIEEQRKRQEAGPKVVQKALQQATSPDNPTPGSSPLATFDPVLTSIVVVAGGKWAIRQAIRFGR